MWYFEITDYQVEPFIKSHGLDYIKDNIYLKI